MIVADNSALQAGLGSLLSCWGRRYVNGNPADCQIEPRIHGDLRSSAA